MDALLPDDPQWVGPYRLDGRLGAGGMGHVYLGTSPGGRKVAVKLIRRELAETPEFRARFTREVEAARRVGGFHTAQVVDADPHAAAPWLVTAFIPGPTLGQLVTEHGPLKPDAVRRLGAGLAEGLAAIHGCGLVHRDLKPGNIIIAEDGPRVIDFGIARAVDASSLTATGMVIGTYSFMSPEQVRADRAGPAGDVFSLGSVLGFAATGRGPFDAPGVFEVVQRILEEAPALDGLDGLDGDLHRLLTSCLAKNPADRPQVATLAAQFAGRPASGPAGRPPVPRQQTPLPPTAEQTRLLAPAPQTPLPTAATAPDPPLHAPSGADPSTRGAGSGGVSRRAIILGGLAAAATATAVGVPLLMREDDDNSGSPKGDSPGKSGSDGVSLAGPDSVQTLAFTPDGKSLLATGGDGTIWRWNVSTRRGISTRVGVAKYTQPVVFSPDLELLVRAEENKVRLWNVSTGRVVRTFTGITDYENMDGFITGVGVSPDGKTLAAGTAEGLYLWDVTSGRTLTVHKDLKYGLAKYSPDGKLLLGGFPIQVREVSSGRTLATIEDSTNSSDAVFSPDGQILAVARLDETVLLWNTSVQQEIVTLKGHKNTVHQLAFHPDGRMLAAVDGDGVARLWDTATGKATATFKGPNSMETVAFSPDGKTLAVGLNGGTTSSGNDTVRLWPVP